MAGDQGVSSDQAICPAAGLSISISRAGSAISAGIKNFETCPAARTGVNFIEAESNIPLLNGVQRPAREDIIYRQSPEKK